MKKSVKIVMSLVVLFSLCLIMEKNSAAKAKVVLSTDKLSLYVGENTKIKISPAKGYKLVSKSFSASDGKIVSVSKSGVVKALSEGTVKVTVKGKVKKKRSKKPFSASISLKVNRAPGLYDKDTLIESFDDAVAAGEIQVQSTGFDDDIIMKVLKTLTGTLILPEDIARIEAKAFYESGLKEVIYPETFTHVGPSAFEDAQIERFVCSGTSKLKYLEDNAFLNCKSLKEVDTGDAALNGPKFAGSGLETFDVAKSESLTLSCFKDCKNLKSLHIGKSLKKVIENLKGCENLTEITVDPDNQTFSDYGGNMIIEKASGTLYAGCKGTVLNDKVLGFNYDVFSETALPETLTIPATVTKIPAQCFNKATGVKEIILPDTLTEIGADAFDYVALTKLYIPKGVTCGEGCFSYSDYPIAFGDTKETLSDRLDYILNGHIGEVTFGVIR